MEVPALPSVVAPPPEAWPSMMGMQPAGAFPGIAASGMIAPPGSMTSPNLASVTPQVDLVAQAAAAAAAAAAAVDPVAEAKRHRELAAARAERAKQLKRGPGVAALVQGALKRAQTQPIVTKKSDADRYEDLTSDRVAERVDDDSESESEDAIRKKREEAAKVEARKRKEQAEREAQERERVEREARERREQAKREAAEAERALQKKEAETREQRIKASVEAAKKQQAERSAAKAAKDAVDSLYANMPQPNLEDEAALNQARMMEAVVREKANSLTNLPPEDRSKVVFLDVDGVLRPARAGGFDILSIDGDAAVRVDTSDFFPSAMKALRHIIERTGAVVVLSSEWRRSDALRLALTDIFEKNRMRLWAFVTTTALELEPGPDPVRQFAERRAREVTQWLNEHEGDVSGWVVLDDINLAIADEAKKPSTKSMASRLVQTWPLCGLTMGNAKTAVRILNGEMINKVVVERPTTASGGLSTPMPRAGGSAAAGSTQTAAASAMAGSQGSPGQPGAGAPGVASAVLGSRR